MNTLIRLVLFVALGVVTYFCVTAVTGNARTLQSCRQQVVTTLNEVLRQRRLDPLATIDFPGTSMFLGVPAMLSFEASVFRSEEPGGRRCLGSLEGTYDRKRAVIEVNFKFSDGTEAQEKAAVSGQSAAALTAERP